MKHSPNQWSCIQEANGAHAWPGGGGLAQSPGYHRSLAAKIGRTPGDADVHYMPILRSAAVHSAWVIMGSLMDCLSVCLRSRGSDLAARATRSSGLPQEASSKPSMARRRYLPGESDSNLKAPV